MSTLDKRRQKERIIMEILTNLNYIGKLIDAYRLDTAINEMRDLLDSQHTSLEQLDELVHAESINDLILNRVEEGPYGWMSVGTLYDKLEDYDAMWFQLERGRLKNLTEEDVYDFFNETVDALKQNLEWEFDEERDNVADLLRELLNYYDEQDLEDEMHDLDEFISNLSDVSFEGFMPLYNQFQELVAPVQVDESITLSPELNACLTTATESMESLKDYLEYLEA